MKEGGQVFTLDMLFAIVLVASFVMVSGQALETTSNQGRSYSTRYSLERVANDAADVLVKTPGMPTNWENIPSSLEVPGLAKINRENTILVNFLDWRKLCILAALMKSDNWDQTDDETQAIMKLFGGTDKFEISLVENGSPIWSIWPRWDVENSGVENALEVAVAKRLTCMRYGLVESSTGPIVRAKKSGNTFENLSFTIYPGELELFDWYIIAETATEKENQINWVEIWVDRDEPAFTPKKYKFDPNDDGPENIFPNDTMPESRGHGVSHGGMENDIQSPYYLHEPPEEGQNYLKLKINATPPNLAGKRLEISVVGVPACSSLREVARALQTVPLTLRIKVWR